MGISPSSLKYNASVNDTFLNVCVVPAKCATYNGESDVNHHTGMCVDATPLLMKKGQSSVHSQAKSINSNVASIATLGASTIFRHGDPLQHSSYPPPPSPDPVALVGWANNHPYAGKILKVRWVYDAKTAWAGLGHFVEFIRSDTHEILIDEQQKKLATVDTKESATRSAILGRIHALRMARHCMSVYVAMAKLNLTAEH